MVKKLSQREKELPKSRLLTILLALFYFSLFLLVIYLGFCFAIPDKYKILTINFVEKHVDIINSYKKFFKSIENQFIFILLYTLCILLGSGSLLYILHIWFRKTPYIEFFKLSFIPKVPNAFYAEDLVRNSAKVKELSSKLTLVNKDLTRHKIELQKVEIENQKLKSDNRELADNLTNIKTSFDILKEVVDQHGHATEEMYKLMDHVLLLKSIEDPNQFFNEFSVIMSEFANTIIKVTVDHGSDKYSSIMMVPPGESYLRIVGSNGLNHASKQKKFNKGQGFAGWIWETGSPAICDDVTSDLRFQQEGCQPSGLYKSIIGVPICDLKNSVIGALFVQCKRINVFDQERDSATLSYFAKLLAIIFTEYYSFREKVMANGNNIGHEQLG